MAIDPISALPPAPSIAVPSTFEALADAFLGALPDFGTDLNTMATQYNAASAALNATLAAAGLSGTSTTSMVVGTGAKSWTMNSGLLLLPGANIIISDTAAPTTNFMIGKLSNYDKTSGAATGTMTAYGGSGTKTSWNIQATGDILALAVAAVADIRAGTDPTKYIASSFLMAAAAKQTLTDAATVTMNAANAWYGKLVMGGNRAIAAPTNIFEGITYVHEIVQPASGGPYTPTLNAAFEISSPVWSTTANKSDLLFSFCYDASTPKFRSSLNKAP